MVYYYTLYILHIVNIFVFFLSPEQLHFGCKKCMFSHSFSPKMVETNLILQGIELPTQRRV